MEKPLPTPELLRKLLRYEPDTGKLFWRERTPDLFSSGKHSAAHRCNRWNSRYRGEEAFTANVGLGYLVGGIFDRLHRAHRVIWAMETGAWPLEDIDHINGVRDDNRMINLRAVSRTENMRNAKMPKSNTSGTVGVLCHNPTGRWRAEIKVDGKALHLGLFDKKSDATAARKAAEVKYGFHPNHGRQNTP